VVQVRLRFATVPRGHVYWGVVRKAATKFHAFVSGLVHLLSSAARLALDFDIGNCFAAVDASSATICNQPSSAVLAHLPAAHLAFAAALSFDELAMHQADLMRRVAAEIVRFFMPPIKSQLA
jgi:hypothetical protein